MADRAAKQSERVFDPLDFCCLLAFFASAPALLPNLDSLRRLMLEATGIPLQLFADFGLTLLTTMAIAAMFTALAVLFICLLKTTYGGLSRQLVFGGGLAYLIGLLVLFVAAYCPTCPLLVEQIAGVPVGFGFAILCMAWIKRVTVADYRSSFFVLVCISVAALSVDALTLALTPLASLLLIFALASLGCAGCLRRFARYSHKPRRNTASGSNWWDVFGKLDVSLLEGAKDFASPLSRVFFFLVTPLVILLLFVVGTNLSQTVYSQGYPLVVVGGLIGTICATPLLFIKTDYGIVNFGYRFYLPLIAFAVFIVNSFVDPGLHWIVIDTGVYAFCTLYGLLLCAMFVTMAGRMKSLALPTVCMLIIALFLVVLLSYRKMDAGALDVYQLPLLMALFVIAVVLLFAMPSSTVWHNVLDGVSAAAAAEDVPEPTLAQRCQQLSLECGLTPRESEILQYLGRGYGSAYIATVLVIAESTVRSHVKSIYRKTHISSREELLKRIDGIEIENKVPE